MKPSALVGKVARARSVIVGPGRKPLPALAREVIAAQFEGRSSITPSRWYFDRLLYLADAGPAAGYLTGPERDALYDAKRRGPGWYRLYQDKTLFDEHFRTAARAGHEPFPLPAYLGQTRTGTLVRDGCPEVSAHDAEAFAVAVSSMRDASPTGRLFAKPAIANKGAGAFLLDKDAGADRVERLRRDVLAADYVFQEAVRQHPELDRLYAGSLNTLRILTGMGADGSRPVLSVILRVGRSGRAVDNAHAGGLFIGVDQETGRLRGPHGGPALARTLRMHGGEVFNRHPDTGVLFEGFTVPFLAEATDIARRALDRLPLLYAGWDVGITPEGPVLIEGNPEPYLQMMEAANGGLAADPAFRAFLDGHGIRHRARS